MKIDIKVGHIVRGIKTSKCGKIKEGKSYKILRIFEKNNRKWVRFCESIHSHPNS
jgi:hypothetical protein